MSSVARQNQSSFGMRIAMTIAVTLALVAGLLVTQDTRAKPARGVSVSDRAQAQSDLCDVSGGKFESRDYYGSYTNGHQFKKNVTTCTGGKNPQTCTNTKTDTTCGQARVILPSHQLPGGVAVEENRVDGAATSFEPTAEPTAEPGVVDAGTVVDDGTVIDRGQEPGVVAEPLVDDGATGDAVGTLGPATEPTGETAGDVAVDGGEVNDGSTLQPDSQ